MPIIALQGLKGGVGTTSVTAGLAWALTRLEQSVLVIDFSSDNILRLYFNTPFKETRGWARGMLDGQPWQNNALRYTGQLDFVPFGITSQAEQVLLSSPLKMSAGFMDAQLNITSLKKQNKYDWILFDIPVNNPPLFARHSLAVADYHFCLLNPDMSCHVQLHQKQRSKNTYFLVNRYDSTHKIQQDLLILWKKALPELIPFLLHADAAIAESLAAKQPIGEYRPASIIANELLNLASWSVKTFEEAKA